ncbi:MAG: hypothetical protein LBC75_00980 [Fibromonadaceae bacterium]|nr:hypothetical protein [Fibromonadaceae bacterium]
MSATNGLDIQLGTNSSISSGNQFIKYKLTVSNGMTVTFTSSDLTDGSNLQSITIQNRTGVNFNAIYIRPSSMPDESSDWGNDYGSLSNNNDKSISIPLSDGQSRTYTVSQPLSSDIDIMLGTNSNINNGNQFVKSDVSLSEGMIAIFTPDDLQ